MKGGRRGNERQVKQGGERKESRSQQEEEGTEKEEGREEDSWPFSTGVSGGISQLFLLSFPFHILPAESDTAWGLLGQRRVCPLTIPQLAL